MPRFAHPRLIVSWDEVCNLRTGWGYHLASPYNKHTEIVDGKAVCRMLICQHSSHTVGWLNKSEQNVWRMALNDVSGTVISLQWILQVAVTKAHSACSHSACNLQNNAGDDPEHTCQWQMWTNSTHATPEEKVGQITKEGWPLNRLTTTHWLSHLLTSPSERPYPPDMVIIQHFHNEPLPIAREHEEKRRKKKQGKKQRRKKIKWKNREYWSLLTLHWWVSFLPPNCTDVLLAFEQLLGRKKKFFLIHVHAWFALNTSNNDFARVKCVIAAAETIRLLCSRPMHDDHWRKSFYHQSIFHSLHVCRVSLPVCAFVLFSHCCGHFPKKTNFCNRSERRRTVLVFEEYRELFTGNSAVCPVVNTGLFLTERYIRIWDKTEETAY